MPKHIGMVGVASIGSALCYRHLFRIAGQTLPPDQHPPFSVFNLPWHRYLEAVQRDDWRAVAALLHQSAETLAAIGAEICFTPDNMVQYALPLVTRSSPIPWVNMAEVVADSVASGGHRRVGIIGTSIVMSGSTYQAHLGVKGIHITKPAPDDVSTIERIILSELAFGFISESALSELQRIVDRMGEDGCDAVLFGCSEAALLSERGGWSLPTYDSSVLVAREVLRLATEDAG